MDTTIASNTSAAFAQQAADHIAAQQASFDRCDTDGFVSQWAHGIQGQVAQRNAEIAANGGVATFWAYTATDLDGTPLSFRRAETKFGFKLVVDTADGEVWVDPAAKRPATNAKKGVIVGRSEFTAPAHAHTWAPASARGLSGACSVQVLVSPDDRKLKYDGRVL